VDAIRSHGDGWWVAALAFGIDGLFISYLVWILRAQAATNAALAAHDLASPSPPSRDD